MMTVWIGGSVLLIVVSGIALVLGFSGTDDTLLWTSIGASGGAALFLGIAYFQSKHQSARTEATDERRVEASEEETALDTAGGDEGPPADAEDRSVAEERRADADEPADEAKAAADATAQLPVPDVSPAPSDEETAPAPKKTTRRKTTAARAKTTTARSKTTRARTRGAAASGEAPGGEEAAAVVSASDVEPETAPETAPEPAASSGGRTASAKSRTTEVVGVPASKKFHRPDCRYASAAGGERLSKTTARRRGYAACGVCKP